MRKLLPLWLAIVVAITLFAIPAWGDGLQSNTFTSVTPGSSVRLINTGIGFHKLTWNVVSGSPAACTVALDSSVDGVTWTAGGVITGQTCTANGASAIVNLVVNYVRINMTALSAGGTVAVTWNGYNNNPAGGTGTIGGATTASHLTYASAANTAADVAGSTVTGGTGAINLTAGADTTIPLQIISHSATQSSATLDVASSAAAAALSSAPVEVRGTGSGGFGPPRNLKSLLNVQVDSQTTAWPLVVTSNTAGLNSAVGLQMLDNGIGSIFGGGAVGDGSSNFAALDFDANQSVYGAVSQPGSIGMLASLNSNGQTGMTLWRALGSAGPSAANMFQIAVGTLGFPLAGFDSGGAPGTQANVNVFFNGITSGGAKLGVAAVAGTPATIQLPTSTGAAGAVLQTDGNTPQQTSWVTPTSLSCTYQGPLSAVVGTGAAATYYTCSVPALAAGTGIAITSTARHTTGTANVAYTVQFGGTSTTASTPTGAANQIEVIRCLLMNNPGSTAAQTVTTTYQDSAAGTNVIVLNTMAINTTGAQTLNLQFNVAATDQVTPEQFVVQLVR